MIKVEDREQIRRAYYVEGKSIRQIAQELGHSRPTVRQALESAESSPYTRVVSGARVGAVPGIAGSAAGRESTLAAQTTLHGPQDVRVHLRGRLRGERADGAPIYWSTTRRPETCGVLAAGI